MQEREELSYKYIVSIYSLYLSHAIIECLIFWLKFHREQNNRSAK